MFSIKKQSDVIKGTERDIFVIDIHSHILPNVDDGSSSIEESMSMLRQSYAQGVRRIVATPHFYPDKCRPDEFFACRDEAFERLKAAIDQSGEPLPEVVTGAEVAYFYGMSRYEDLDRFCIGNTRLLLVEMPFEKWSSRVVDELREIRDLRGLSPIVAHAERYIFKQSDSCREALFASGALIQTNAEAFVRFGVGRKMMKLLSCGRVNFLGSDCHGATFRAPDVKDALIKIEKRLGRAALEELLREAYDVFEEHKI